MSDKKIKKCMDAYGYSACENRGRDCKESYEVDEEQDFLSDVKDSACIVKKGDDGIKICESCQ